jgi:hypothetical protein
MPGLADCNTRDRVHELGGDVKQRRENKRVKQDVGTGEPLFGIDARPAEQEIQVQGSRASGESWSGASLAGCTAVKSPCESPKTLAILRRACSRFSD